MFLITLIVLLGLSSAIRYQVTYNVTEVTNIITLDDYEPAVGYSRILLELN